jgi:hypothetical protein
LNNEKYFIVHLLLLICMVGIHGWSNYYQEAGTKAKSRFVKGLALPEINAVKCSK